MIKVLAVMDGTGTGGAETSMAAMAPLMAENGVELEVAYFHDRSGAKEKFIEAGIPLIHVPHGRNRLVTVWRLRRVIKERRPDLVHTMVFEADIIGRTAAFLARVPVMSSIINEMYGPEQIALSRHAWKVRLGQLADIITARFVVRFHAITNNVADVMAPRLRIDRSKIDVIYRGRDPRQLGTRTSERRARVRQQLGVPDSAALLLAVGRHEPQKGLGLLLEAMSLIREQEPRAVLVVAGRPGSATANLMRQVDDLNLADYVRFLGHREDVPDLLAASDVMIFPSRWEGLGGAVIEALMIGCCVVCSDLQVLREVVEAADASRLAYFADCTDPQSIGTVVAAALDESSAYDARTPIDPTSFLLETVVRQHASLMTSLVENP